MVDLIGRAAIRVDMDSRGALRSIQLLQEQFSTAERSATRLERSTSRVGSVLGALGKAAAVAGGAVAAFGSAAPAVAGVAAALANLAPAAGVAATGILALTSAQAAFKIGTLGVEDALKSAFDPSKAEEFNEALKNLSPNARDFVTAIKEAEPAFTKVRKAVQDRLFDDLDKTLARTAKATVPALRRSLLDSAGTLNQMAKGVGAAAVELGESGTLGKALGSANRGLKNLTGVPPVLVKGFGQVAAAAGPSFERLTKAARGAADKLGTTLTRAFESGAMQRSIETAVDLAKQLGQGLANVGKVLGNVFRAADQSGAGLIGNFKTLTGELAKVTASSGVQSGLRTLFETMGTVGRTAARLLGEAIKGIAPVVTALGPPVQNLVRSLGSALTPIIRSLSPVLTSLATNAGRVVSAFSPLLTVAGQLVSGALKGLEPLLDAVGEQVALLAESVMNFLGPSLKVLPQFVNPLLGLFGKLASLWIGLQNDVLSALQPSLSRLGQSLGRVYAAVAPLVPAFTSFVELGLRGFAAAAQPVIAVAGKIAEILAGKLAAALNHLAAWIGANRGKFEAVFRQGERAIVDFALAAVAALPEVFHLFRTLANNALDAFRVIAVGSVKLFGWIPGVGDKVRSAAENFLDFSRLAKEGLDKAGREVNDFARNAAPKLQQNRLEMDIRDWQGKIKEAKRLLGDKNLPPRKRAKLEAEKRDLERKVAGAKKDLASIKDQRRKITVSTNALGTARSAQGAIKSVKDKTVRLRISTTGLGTVYAAQGAIRAVRSKTVTVTVQNRTLGQGAFGRVGATGGLVPGGLKLKRFQVGGTVRGPGTGTSDSVPALLSNGEFVVRAAAVRRFGADFFDQINSMRVPRMAGGGRSPGAAAPAGMTVVHNHYHFENHAVIGSRREVEDWLVKTMDRLRQQRRLPPGMGA